MAGANSTKPWSSTDITLAMAYQILENERCPQCGLYVWMCHSEDRDMQFDVIEDICEVKRLISDKEKALGDKAQSHVALRPYPVMANPKRDFSDLRRPYFEEQAKRFADDV